MRRVIVFLAAAVLALGLAAPAVLAAHPTFDHTGTVLMAFNGDVTVPPGETADAVFVPHGTATSAARSRRSSSSTDRRSSKALGRFGLRDRRLASASMPRAPSAATSGRSTRRPRSTLPPRRRHGGQSRTDLVAAGAVLVPAIVLFMLGFALVTIVSGLALAALAARQVRSAETLMETETGADRRWSGSPAS